MAFEDIEVVRPKAASKAQAPAGGIAVTACKVARRNGGGLNRYIRLTIGGGLARKISLTAPEHRLRLLFGTGEDAGKVRVTVDNEGGKFLAKRSKQGNYALTINSGTAKGLFALDFPAFVEDGIEALRPANGQPPHFVFKASAAMLAADDDD